MTVNELATALALTPLCAPEPDRPVTGGYCGDLLSWVMGRAKSGQAWVTIMTNINVAAVAALTDVACVILAEDSKPEESVVEKAKEEGINLFTSPQDSFSLCAGVDRLLRP